MAQMTDRELLALVDSEFSSAMGAPDGDISSERAKAWNYYLARKLGNEVEGQSQVVSHDVAEVVDSIMPSLLRIFTTRENLVSFEPMGPEDEESAAQESDYVNYAFFKPRDPDNPAFMLLYNWFFDALVQKNGIVKAWWDESEEITTETYEGLSEAEVFALLEDEELEPLERSERSQETVDDMGQVVQSTVHDITFQRTTKQGRLRVENVPPEEYRISSDARRLGVGHCRMVGQEREITRSDLLAMGFSREAVQSLPAHGANPDSSEEIARRNKTDDTQGALHDRSQDMILVREAYIRVDYQNNGKSELRQVFTAGNQILSNEPADRRPFHVLCPQPLPHKHFGRAMAEKVIDVQEVNTTLLRQILDNLYLTNNPKQNVWEQAIGENTLDDLLTSRAGGINRFARPPGESYTTTTIPFTASATFPMLEYFDKVKRDRTGVSADSEGLSPDALKHIQQSVMGQAIDQSKLKIEAIARIFAETGIKSLFLHIHELLLKHQKKAELVKLRGQWVPVDPTSWRTRYDMTVNIGLGIGSRESNLIHLQAIKEMQAEIVASGGMNLLVTPRNIYNTAAEFVKNANLKVPELFFTDPGNQMAPPPSDEQQQLEQMQAQIQQRQQELDAAKQQLSQQKLQLEQERIMLQHQREVAKLENDREGREDKLAVEFEKLRNQVTELELKYGQSVPGSKV